MLVVFDLVCPECGRPSRCEAPAPAAGEAPAREVRYECPRCRRVVTAPAAGGRPADAPTPWAVRADRP